MHRWCFRDLVVDASLILACYALHMLAIDRITEIARDVARKKLDEARVADVRVEPMVDWVGDEGLRVLIVLHSFAVEQLKAGGEIGTESGELSRRWQHVGEDRHPYHAHRVPAGGGQSLCAANPQ
jgi:hypothetical protein